MVEPKSSDLVGYVLTGILKSLYLIDISCWHYSVCYLWAPTLNLLGGDLLLPHLCCSVFEVDIEGFEVFCDDGYPAALRSLSSYDWVKVAQLYWTICLKLAHSIPAKDSGYFLQASQIASKFMFVKNLGRNLVIICRVPGLFGQQSAFIGPLALRVVILKEGFLLVLN